MRTLLAITVTVAIFAAPAAAQAPRGLTAVSGIKVGHFTLSERPTGCTVVLAERGAVAGVDVRGSAPGTRETDLLDPVNAVEQVHAIVLAGGSAFGLDAASGVVRYLDEKGVGFKIGRATVPIVPAAILIDLEVGSSEKIRPTAECGYRAAQSATAGEIAEGNVGAGAGATVGKLAGYARGMKGGLATASITLPTGLTVSALVAVNAVGDVIDPQTGRAIAGVRTVDGSAIDDIKALVRSGARPRAAAGGNTTLAVVATNATLTKAQATKVAQMAQDGFARAIYPAHTMYDGDTVFALATGETAGGDVTTIGALAADMVSEAIVRAVTNATGIPGYPAARDLRSGGQASNIPSADIRAVLDRYVKAVNDADEDGLRDLWAQPETVSYVNPVQRLRSWEELQGFWRGFLKTNFTRRELKPGNVAIDAAGDAAWAVFDWEFSAVLADGKSYQSRGWETHVYRRTNRGWRISHVHYSVPATP